MTSVGNAQPKDAQIKAFTLSIADTQRRATERAVTALAASASIASAVEQVQLSADSTASAAATESYSSVIQSRRQSR